MNKKVFVLEVTLDKTEAEVSARREKALEWLKGQIGEFEICNNDNSRLGPWWKRLFTKSNIAASGLVLFIGDFENGEIAPHVFRALRQRKPIAVYEVAAGEGRMFLPKENKWREDKRSY
jgi:hypothetical protein